MIWATSPSQGTKLLVVSYLCALFQSTSFEEKVWGRGWKKFSRLSAQSFLQFHVWHNRLGRTRRKFEQRRNYCKFWRELFGKKMRGPVHSSDKKSNGEASFMDSQCVSACRALDVPRRELERRHLCRFIALAAPSSCNTRLHMLHVSKSRNNNNNSLLQAPPGDQIAHVAHLQRQQQQEQPFSVQIEATKRTTTTTTSLCFFGQNATGYSKYELILFYSCFILKWWCFNILQNGRS